MESICHDYAVYHQHACPYFFMRLFRKMCIRDRAALFPDTPAVAMPSVAHVPAEPDGQISGPALRDCIYAAGNFVVR